MHAPSKSIDARVRIGHVHLEVCDLERVLEFYCGILGFELMRRVAMFLSMRYFAN